MAVADPIRRFRRWLADARAAGIELAETAALATADSRGRPSVRYMLLKDATAEGFVFYTNTASRKSREMRANPWASLAFYWHETGRQVRVEGRIKPVSAEEADAYWAERPGASQIASRASRQSHEIPSRAALLAEFKRLEKKFAGCEVPRPAGWTGSVLIPNRIEFWTRHEPRLHHRELFVRKGGNWSKRILSP